MIFSSNYLPCIEYMATILKQNEININISEQYRKQSYRTRAYILGPHQVETLNVPIKKAPNNTLMKDIEISYAENWQLQHAKTIQNAYKNSPFYEHLYYLFEPIYKNKTKYLIDLNTEALSICLKILKSKQTICHNSYEYFEYKNEFISFSSKNRADLRNSFLPKSYFQNFGNNFEPNLSVIDLLFSKGSESNSFLS